MRKTLQQDQALPVGTRVRLTRDVEIYPVGVFKAGLTGIVTATRGSGDDTDLESVRLDETFESLDEWDNELQWRHRDVCYGPGINMNDDIDKI